MRVLITGPECTGKSTLAEQLSEQLRIPWFPEYARQYLLNHGPSYQQKDILRIAKEHYKLAQVFPEDQPMIYDTYLLNLSIWSELKYGISEPWIIDKLQVMEPFEYIFLLYPNLPWKQDGFRENEAKGVEIFNHFKAKLSELSWKYHVINELGHSRFESVLAFLTK